MKEAARLAREKSQDKTELTNPALNITSHQVMLRTRRGQSSLLGKMVPALISGNLCASILILFCPRAFSTDTEVGDSHFDDICGPEVTLLKHMKWIK